ncbi:MAG: esterase-like activity of phytase family protein [Gammaproteobacteria bacterium]|nr:esterase-like activity of phytase family protein [Gammaproteobacteria bacterium]
MWLLRLALFIFIVIDCGQVRALDYEVIDAVSGDGAPLTIGKIKILSVHRLFTTSINGQDMVELSGLAWSEDDNILYALSDHGALFHFRPLFDDKGLSDIKLLNAYPLKDASGKSPGYPWGDSEGLYLRNGSNGKPGDDELLISFELKPRLQWHQPDGRFIRKEGLPDWMEDRSSYHRRHKALESVAIHPEYGVITTPEYPMAGADWALLTLYRANGDEMVAPRDTTEDMAVCAIEVMPDGGLLVLERRHRLLAPTWTAVLAKLSPEQGDHFRREEIARMQIGGKMPVDNYEGLTRHVDNRYFMISDNNEHFTQRTLLVYFELLP